MSDFDKDLFEYQLQGATLFDGTGYGEEVRRAIGRALRRLPEEVREFALDRCVFLPTGSAAHYLSLDHIELWREAGHSWLVLIPHYDSPEDAESVVAHEVAHLWLGHGESGSTGTEEEDVAALVSEWGFHGEGTIPNWTSEEFDQAQGRSQGGEER